MNKVLKVSKEGQPWWRFGLVWMVIGGPAVVVVELEAGTELPKILSSLLEAEINILTTYGFLVRPEGKTALCLNLDDNDLGAQVLSRGGFRLLGQNDISR